MPRAERCVSKNVAEITLIGYVIHYIGTCIISPEWTQILRVQAIRLFASCVVGYDGVRAKFAARVVTHNGGSQPGTGNRNLSLGGRGNSSFTYRKGKSRHAMRRRLSV